MSGPVKHSKGDAPRKPVVSPWTDEKVEAILMAFRSFVSNQAAKHGVPASQVWDLVRDEVLDQQGRP
jgi:hypothetical protein